MLPTTVFLGFSGGSDGKESASNVGDLGLILGLERSPGEGHGNSLQNYNTEVFILKSILFGCAGS